MKKYVLKKTHEMIGGSSQKNVETIYYFFSDDCHFCDEFKPEWEKIKDYYKNNINCIKYYGREYPELKKKYKVDGYPTIIFENNDKSFFEYRYKREFNNIKNYIKELNY